MLLRAEATSSPSSNSQGSQAFIVPRALFLESKLEARFDNGYFYPISSAPFYGEDLGASAVSAAAAGLVAATLSGGDAKFLLDRLLEDTSGVVVPRAVPMYDATLRATLPQDVVTILPWSPSPWDPLGPSPRTSGRRSGGPPRSW